MEFFLIRIFPHSDQKKLLIWTHFTQCKSFGWKFCFLIAAFLYVYFPGTIGRLFWLVRLFWKDVWFSGWWFITTDGRVLVGDYTDEFGNFFASSMVNDLSLKVSPFSCNSSLDTWSGPETYANFLDIPLLLSLSLQLYMFLVNILSI